MRFRRASSATNDCSASETADLLQDVCTRSRRSHQAPASQSRPLR
ncbi:hypothetical protein GQ607_003265 [Colletotrichum asianum]|uniref:Uncharacterized protein n=1 Tax=Colletotrichum asianum TaxID=702518 RepID=A0A8H3WPR0_9PEZI|nr:hypothetical protein GQ607_003265 [Colletotrichum asianum]